VIALNNTFPAEQLNKIRAVIERGSCDRVIGLSPIIDESDEEDQDIFDYPTQQFAALVKMPLPYPGLAAVFICCTNAWDKPFDSGAPLCRMIKLKSITDGSLVKEFSLLGYQDGTVQIQVSFEKTGAFLEYLRAYGITCNTDTYKTQTAEELEKIFNIIAFHNDIPPEQLKLIQTVVECGTCNPVRYIRRMKMDNLLLR